MTDATLITRDPVYRPLVERWRSFWALEDQARPFWMIPTTPGMSPPNRFGLPLIDYLQNPASQLAGQLRLLDWRQRANIGDDFVPHLQPQQGTSVFASAFGCRVEYFDHTLPWAHAVIGPDDPPEKVYELTPPDIAAGQLGDMLAFTDRFVAETGKRYPIAVTDLQGPLDTAYLIWDPCSFMVAMYTNPKEVHHLMRLVTDLIIGFVKEQRRRTPEYIPCHFPPLYLPDGFGLAISEDVLAVIGADLYREFAVPYNNELSEEFGGLFVHSCGNFVHQLDNLASLRGLRGLNFGATENPFEPTWERFGGKVAVVPHLGLNKDLHFDTALAYARHVLVTKTTNRGLCLLVGPDDPATFDDSAALGRFVADVQALIERHA